MALKRMLVLIAFLTLLRVQFGMSISHQELQFSSRSKTNKYQCNLPNLLGTLSSHASKTNFHNSSVGEAPNQLYGHYLCRGDLNGEACSDCVNYAKQYILNECLYSDDALYWFDHCMVRYSNKPFFGKLDEHSGSCGSWKIRNSTSDKIRAAEILVDTLNGLVTEVINDGFGEKFATRVVKLNKIESLYAMGQCTWDLNTKDCHKCLSQAMGRLSTPGISSRAKMFYANCMVRYEILPSFFNTPISLKHLPSLAMSQ